MLSSFRSISFSFLLGLLGIYSLNKILLFAHIENTVTLFLERVLITPMGVIAIIHIVSTILLLFRKKKTDNALYDIIVTFLGIIISILFIFYSIYSS